jgi:hypothetical protein
MLLHVVSMCIKLGFGLWTELASMRFMKGLIRASIVIVDQQMYIDDAMTDPVYLELKRDSVKYNMTSQGASPARQKKLS